MKKIFLYALFLTFCSLATAHAAGEHPYEEPSLSQGE